MRIASVITSTHYVPSYGMLEERQRRIVRPYALTHKGAERVLKRQAKENGETWDGIVVRIEYWSAS